MPGTSILENITKNKIKVENELEEKMNKIKGENGRKLIWFGFAFVRSSWPIDDFLSILIL